MKRIRIQKPPQKPRIEVFVPQTTNIVSEILQETYVTDKIDKNLFE